MTIADPRSLPSVPFLKRSQLPTAPGLYFAISDDEVVYIGRARNLAARWYSRNHHRCGDLVTLPAVRLSWLLVESEDALSKLEAQYIKELRPRLNRAPLLISAQLWEEYKQSGCDKVIYALRDAIEQAGSAKEWGEKNDVSPQFISDVLAGRRPPSQHILKVLGYRSYVDYVEV